MVKIRARAPLRVSYAGGGTDVPPYPGLKGGVVLSSTIQNYAYCSIAPRTDGMVTVFRQDQYASTFGGFNLIEFKKGANIVNPLRIKRETLNELEYNSLLCFTGTTRRSGGILQRQIESYENRELNVMDALERMKELTLEMKDSLLTGNLTEFARLLNSEWETKKALDSAISNDEIDKLLQTARQNGAIGGKLLGAGGGGFLFLYCEPGKRVHVEKEVERLGGQAFPVRFDLEGLQTWRSPK